jgi:hypothetical protein
VITVELATIMLKETPTAEESPLTDGMDTLSELEAPVEVAFPTLPTNEVGNREETPSAGATPT